MQESRRVTSTIRYQRVTKTYANSEHAAVYDVTLDVGEARFVVLLGPSGCGKTTLLKMTNRLIEPTSGVIEISGRDITSVSATELRRHIGYVIQQVGLFPHFTVEANIATVPRLLGWAKSRIRDRVYELMDLVGLDPQQFRKRYPHQLSGGQQQRVGLARALAADPAILLMDEPFGAIDAITRGRLQEQLLEIQRRVRKTVLFVTHDVDEALRLGDELVVMRDGQVVQHDVPVQILTAPANSFVRELMNSDDVLRELGVISVRSAMTPPVRSEPGDDSINADESLRVALSKMLAAGTDVLAVSSGDEVVGRLTMGQIRSAGRRGADHGSADGRP